MVINSVEALQEDEQPREVLITKVVSEAEEENNAAATINREDINEILDQIKVDYPGNGRRVAVGLRSSEVINDAEDCNTVQLNIHGQVNRKNFNENINSVEIIRTDSNTGLTGVLDVEVRGNVQSKESRRGCGSSQVSGERGRVNLHIRGDLRNQNDEQIDIDQVKRVKIVHDNDRQDIRERDRVVVNKNNEDCNTGSSERLRINKDAHVRVEDENVQISSREDVHQNYRNRDSGERSNAHAHVRENIEANIESGEQRSRVLEHEHSNYYKSTGGCGDKSHKHVHQNKHNNFDRDIDLDGNEKLRFRENVYLRDYKNDRNEHSGVNLNTRQDVLINNQLSKSSSSCSRESKGPITQISQQTRLNEHQYDRNSGDRLRLYDHERFGIREQNNQAEFREHGHTHQNYRDGLTGRHYVTNDYSNYNSNDNQPDYERINNFRSAPYNRFQDGYQNQRYNNQYALREQDVSLETDRQPASYQNRHGNIQRNYYHHLGSSTHQGLGHINRERIVDSSYQNSQSDVALDQESLYNHYESQLTSSSEVNTVRDKDQVLVSSTDELSQDQYEEDESQFPVLYADVDTDEGDRVEQIGKFTESFTFSKTNHPSFMVLIKIDTQINILN